MYDNILDTEKQRNAENLEYGWEKVKTHSQL